jgi:hypothetical protein
MCIFNVHLGVRWLLLCCAVSAQGILQCCMQHPCLQFTAIIILASEVDADTTSRSVADMDSKSLATLMLLRQIQVCSEAQSRYL